MPGKAKKIAVVSAVISVLLSLLLAFMAVLTVYEITAVISKNSETHDYGDISLEGLPEWVTSEILLTSLRIQEEHGIYASVTIAQAQQEVGGTWNGTSLYATASVDYNLFGLKKSGSISVWGEEVTWDGTVGATGTYRKYTSYAQGLKDRARLLLTSSTYSNVAKTAFQSSKRQLEELSKSPWCENQYSTLEKYMDYFDLWRLDAVTADSLVNSGESGGNHDGTITSTQKTIVANARNNNGTRPCTAGYCAAWVSGIYERSGLGYPGGNAIDYWNRWKGSGSTKMSNIPPGAAIVSSGSGIDGARYGHVGIYLGDGMVASNIGYLKIETLQSYIAWNTATCQGHTGYIGWVYPFGRPF